MHVRGHEKHGKSLSFPLNFVINLKLLWKIKSWEKYCWSLTFFSAVSTWKSLTVPVIFWFEQPNAWCMGMHAKSPQSGLNLCNPMDCSSPGSSVHGILHERILDWVAISYSRGSSQPRNRTHVSYVSCIGRWVLYHYHHLGRPHGLYEPRLKRKK